MFRFTIRDVLWLMVVVGMGIGWWLDHSALRSLNKFLGRKWIDHARYEHTAEDYQRLMLEVTAPITSKSSPSEP